MRRFDNKNAYIIHKTATNQYGIFIFKALNKSLKLTKR